jgi:hypothetical protein
MTPAQAIKAECRRCKGGQRFECESELCALNKSGRALALIKAHCKECNGDDRPADCTGRMLDGTACLLHPCRLGKNPTAKRRTLSPEQRAAMAARLEKFRFRTGQKCPSATPGGAISPEAGGQ